VPKNQHAWDENAATLPPAPEEAAAPAAHRAHGARASRERWSGGFLLTLLLLMLAPVITVLSIRSAAAAVTVVRAWGANTLNQSTPPFGLQDVAAIDAGGEHNLALRSDGSVRAWGRNTEGQTNVPGGLTAVQVSAGDRFSLALQVDGTVVAWGSNNRGQTTIPAAAVGVTAVAAGSEHVLATLANGSVIAWGRNDAQQATVPTLTPPLMDAVAIAAGERHSLALRSNGSVIGWGSNVEGQLNIPAGSYTAIAAGRAHSLLLRTDGTVRAFGENASGQSTIPIGLAGVVGIAAGGDHSLALLNNGTIVGWGRNTEGQINIPTGITSPTAISAGIAHSIAIATNTAPTISDIPNQVTDEDTPIGPIDFVIGDAETPATGLTVTASSNNPVLIPIANIQLTGTGTTRRITLSPQPNRFGAATITVNVTDQTVVTSDTFVLTVNSVNDVPAISFIGNRVTNKDTPTGPIAFTISDVETAPNALVVTATSSNQAVVANAGITPGGTGMNRNVSITPVAGASGTTVITVSVSDGTDITAQTFNLRVNNPPTISDISDQATAEETPLNNIGFTVGDTDTPLDQLVVTATSSNQTLLSNSRITLGGSGANPTLSLTPSKDQNGTTTVTVTVSDGSASASDTFVLTVTPVEDIPTISDVSNQTGEEDKPTAALPFTVGDGETPAGNLTVTATSSNQTLVPAANVVLGGSGANRTVTLIPAPNQSGMTTITLSVSDGTATVTDSFTLTITAVNDVPTISDLGNQTTEEDKATPPLAFTVGDVETQPLSLTVAGKSSNQTLVPDANIVFGGSGADRTVTITPAPDQVGTVTISITVSDSGAQATDTFQLTITGVNDPPTISNIVDQTTTVGTATVALPFTVGDPETQPFGLAVSGSSSNTTLVPNANVTLSGAGANRFVKVTPAAGQEGTTTITITVSDGLATATDTFVLTVTPRNDPPTISDVGDLTTAEDTATAAVPFTVGDIQTPATNLTVTASSSNTALVPNANLVLGGSGASRTITVTPAANQTGATTITLTVSDGALAASDTFVLTVGNVNDAPTISDVADQSTGEEAATGAISFTVGDLETSAANLTLAGGSSNTALVPNTNIVFGGSGANRTVTITPAADQSGTATITITVSDGTATATDTFVLTVTGVNDAPTISDVQNQSTGEDTATSAIPLTVGDSDNAAADLTLTGSSSNTALVPNANIVFGGTGANRTVTITPAANQSGTATITITVSDGAATASDTFTITVSAVNDAPTISNIANQTTAEETATGAISFTIGDQEEPAANLTLTGSSSNTALVPNANIVFGGTGANRTVTITPAANQSGAATITITVSDGAATASDTFVLTVGGVNDGPTISNIANQSTAEDAATDAVSFTVADSDTPVANLTLTGSSSNTALVPDANIVFGGTGANRTVTITPAANQSGTATITVTVSDGAASASDTFTLTVSAVAPLAPRSLTASASGPGQATLAWTDGSDDESGFAIERRQGMGEFTRVGTSGANVLTFTDTGLAATTAYTYRVRSLKGGLFSGPSNVAAVTTLPAAPAAPTALTATAVSHTQISVTWQDNSGNETSFQVERSTDNGTTFTPVATVGAGVTNYNDTQVTAETRYFYLVRAINAGGFSAYSNQAEATARPNPSGAPSGLAVRALSQTALQLTWTDNSGNETSFQIQRKKAGDAGFSTLANVDANVGSYTDTGLQPDTFYAYRVVAIHPGGASDPSNEGIASTLPASPSAPSGVGVTPLSSTSLRVTWTDASSNETGFKIERALGSNAFQDVATVGADVTSYTDTGLAPFSTYYYRVRAVNAGGESAPTAPGSGRTLTAPSAAPTGLTAEALSGTSIRVEWQDTSGDETGFIIERQQDNGAFSQAGQVGANVTRFDDTGLDENTRYTYRVRAVNGGGPSEPSNEAGAKTPIESHIEVSATTLAFGSVRVGQSVVKSFEIRNTGQSDVRVQIPALSSPLARAVASDDFVIPAGESRSVQVRFRPSGRRLSTQTLRIRTDDPGTRSLRVTVTGRGR